MRRVLGAHYGLNIGLSVIDTIKFYKLKRRLGWCMIDNDSSNDVSLRVISNWLSENFGITWDAEHHRLRCFGHIMCLVVNAYFANKPMWKPKPTSPRSSMSDKPKWTPPRDGVTKILECTTYITASDQREQEFDSYITLPPNDKRRKPIKPNETRWFGLYLCLCRALLLREAYDRFAWNHRTPSRSRRDDKDLNDCIMTSDDWQYIVDTIGFLKPMFLLLEELQNRSDTGTLFLSLTIMSLLTNSGRGPWLHMAGSPSL